MELEIPLSLNDGFDEHDGGGDDDDDDDGGGGGGDDGDGDGGDGGGEEEEYQDEHEHEEEYEDEDEEEDEEWRTRTEASFGPQIKVLKLSCTAFVTNQSKTPLFWRRKEGLRTGAKRGVQTLWKPAVKCPVYCRL